MTAVAIVSNLLDFFHDACSPRQTGNKVLVLF